MIYLKKHEDNLGPFHVPVEPINEAPYYVDITDDPQSFTAGISAGLLSKYSKHIVEVALEDVPAEFLHESDVPEPEPSRFACEVEGCGKDYATQSNLDKHTKGTHGSLIERLSTAKVVESEPVDLTAGSPASSDPVEEVSDDTAKPVAS